MNKQSISISIVLLLGAASLIAALSDEEAWRDFKEKYERNYTSPEEEVNRMRIYLDNRLYIESNNLKSVETTFTQGINHMSDMTTDEIVQTRCGFRSPENHRPEENENYLTALLLGLNRTTILNGTTGLVESTGLDGTMGLNLTHFNHKAWYDSFLGPESLDYRKQNRVSKVKDQGSCGSCWAFATTGALESILAHRGSGILLSEQNLIDCSRGYGNYGCNGGLMDLALRYVRDHGIMSSSQYPYTGKDGECKYKSGNSIISVRGSTILPRGNEALLRLILAMSGPIPVAIDAGARSFHSYQSGVYNDKSCGKNLNHAVLLVGYGTDKVGGDYWLIKNSWGSNWGDSGYIKISRNRGNLCGVASYAVMPIP